MKQILARRTFLWWLSGFAIGMLTTTVALPAPVDTSGYLDYTGRIVDRESFPDTVQQVSTIRTELATYLWRPWIVQLRGGLGLSFTQTEEADNDQQGDLVTGEGQISILPRSYFPFNAFVEREDDRVDGQLSGRDATRTSYGFDQSYLPPGRGQYNLAYRRRESDQRINSVVNLDGVNSDTSQDQIHFNFRRSVNRHIFDFQANMNHEEGDSNGFEETDILNMLRHRYRHNTLSVDNVVFYTDEEDKGQFIDTERSRAQLNSTLFWRPQTKKPLTVSGSALLAENSSETNRGIAGSNSQSLNAFGSVNYRWSPALNYRAAFSTSAARGDAVERNESELRIGASYSPGAIPLHGFAYRWTTSSDAGVREGNQESNGQFITLDSGHGLSRTWPMSGGGLSFNLNEQVGLTEDTLEPSELHVTHTGSLGWSQLGNGASTLIRMSYNDLRNFSDMDSSSQIINLQASRNKQLNRLSSWSGNVTIQAFKLDMEDDNSNGEGRWRTSTSIDLRYQHRRAFGVRRLAFISELRVFSNDLIEFEDPGDDVDIENRNFWSNRLEYRIGRLELRARADLVEDDGENSLALMFQLRRGFGKLN